MGTHNRVIYWWHRFALVFCHRVFAVPASARKIKVMHCAQIGDACFPFRRQALIRTIHVTEVGLSTLSRFRHHFTVNHSGMPSDTLPRTIGMPFQCAFVWVLAIRFAISIQIGESIQLWKTVCMVLVHHMDLNFPKTLG